MIQMKSVSDSDFYWYSSKEIWLLEQITKVLFPLDTINYGLVKRFMAQYTSR